MEKLKNLASDFRFIFWVYVVIALLISLQSYFAGAKSFDGLEYTHYNNFIIFKNSFLHLIGQQDLYSLWPKEQWDLYKYSPSFAALFAPFAYLPELSGLFLWNLLNALVLFWAIKTMPLKQENASIFLLWFVIVEMVTSLQNSQSNALMAGLIILAFNLLQQRKVIWATLCIVLSVYIKLFGLVAFALFLVFPEKVKFILWTIFWTILVGLIPLVFVGPQQLIFLYESWWNMLQADHVASHGLSVMGWLETWFGISMSKLILAAIGVALFCLPLLRIKTYSTLVFRLLLLASILIWVVIFNHKAESPTFIIAICGVGIWYFSQERSVANLLLLGFAFLLTCLSPTDIFPRSIRSNYFEPYVLKAIPCIFIWAKIIWDMMAIQKTDLSDTIRTHDA